MNLESEYIFRILIIFTRISGLFYFFPVISEPYVLSRTRFVIAIFLSILLEFSLDIPNLPDSPSILLNYLAIEFLLGLIVGLSAYMIFISSQITGSILSMQSGLSSAMLFDPNQGGQVSVISNLFTNFLIMALVLSDSHHIMIKALMNSYSKFPVNYEINTGAFANLLVDLVMSGFNLGVKVSAAFLVINTVITVANGILSRLMPSFQVFFVMTPVQIMIVFIIIMLTITPLVNYIVEQIYMQII